MKYGTAKCVAEISLSVWDGSNTFIVVKPGEVLDITYHEYDGSLGLTNSDGIEFCVSSKERASFLETWEH